MEKTTTLLVIMFFYLVNLNTIFAQETDLLDLVEHHYATNEGVKIHYVTVGEGPLLLFVHGFPDFWYSWRDQMEVLSKNYTVAAVDLRGYNLSDSPDGVEHYTFDILEKDLVAVIKDTGKKMAFVVAHDWGAAISWRLAAHHPDLVEKYVALNIAHPSAGDKRVVVSVEEREPSYADYFVSKEFSEHLTENWYSGWVTDLKAKEIYKAAFRKSDKEAMINYYRANFPTLENLKKESFLNRNKTLPNLKMPVLIIHGEQDKYAPTKAHNNTWDFVDNELTIEILQDAGHFVQQEESEKVTELIRAFLLKK